MKSFVPLKELCIILGKSENSLRYHLRKGRIKPTLKLGRHMLFDPEQVLRQLQRGVPKYYS